MLVLMLWWDWRVYLYVLNHVIRTEIDTFLRNEYKRFIKIRKKVFICNSVLFDEAEKQNVSD